MKKWMKGSTKKEDEKVNERLSLEGKWKWMKGLAWKEDKKWMKGSAWKEDESQWKA